MRVLVVSSEYRFDLKVFFVVLGVSHRIQNQNPKDNRIRCKMERIHNACTTHHSIFQKLPLFSRAELNLCSEFKDIKKARIVNKTVNGESTVNQSDVDSATMILLCLHSNVR